MPSNPFDKLAKHIRSLSECMEELSGIWRNIQEKERRYKSLEQSYQQLLGQYRALVAKVNEKYPDFADAETDADGAEKKVLYRVTSEHPLLKRLVNIRLGIENLHTEEKLNQQDLQWLMRYFFYLEELGKILIQYQLNKEWFNEMLNSILFYLVQFRMSTTVVDFSLPQSPENNIPLQFIRKLWLVSENILVRVIENDPDCPNESFAHIIVLQNRIQEDILPHLQQSTKIRLWETGADEIQQQLDDFLALTVSSSLYQLLREQDKIVTLADAQVLKGKLASFGEEPQPKEWQGWRRLQIAPFPDDAGS